MRHSNILLLALGIVAIFHEPAAAQTAEHHDSESVQLVQVPPSIPPALSATDLRQAGKRILKRTNRFRQQHDRPPVATNGKLTATARGFANYMAEHDRYGHTADGRRPSERATQQGYSYCIVLENIAYDYRSRGYQVKQLARDIEQGWEKSPGHRRNMLDDDVVDTGVGLAQSDHTGYVYAVQMFGRPRSLQITFSLSNRSETTVDYEIGKQDFQLPPRFTRTHTRCRPSQVVVHLGEDRSRTIEPSRGDHWRIVREAGELRLQDE